MGIENKTDHLTEMIIYQERRTVDAFKEKRQDLFTENFGEGYIGVAGDGVKTSHDEVKGMMALDISAISVGDEKVGFPAEYIAVMTYTMEVTGKMKEKDISGTIYCSTVFAKREDRWLAVLHTESMAQRQ